MLRAWEQGLPCVLMTAAMEAVQRKAAVEPKARKVATKDDKDAGEGDDDDDDDDDDDESEEEDDEEGEEGEEERERADEAAEEEVEARSQRGGVPAQIDVYWAEDRKYYVADVLSFSGKDGTHRLRYHIDNDEETINLREHKWCSVLTDAEAQAVGARVRVVYQEKKKALPAIAPRDFPGRCGTCAGCIAFQTTGVDAVLNALVAAKATFRQAEWLPVPGADGWSIRWKWRANSHGKHGDVYYQTPGGDEVRSVPEARRWMERGGVADMRHGGGKGAAPQRGGSVRAPEEVAPAGALPEPAVLGPRASLLLTPVVNGDVARVEAVLQRSTGAIYP